jgi:TolB protein
MTGLPLAAEDVTVRRLLDGTLARRRFLLAGAAAAGLLAAGPALAELRIDVTKGFVSPMPIAIPDFFSADGSQARVGQDLTGVIAADLERSGLFRPVDRSAFIQDSASLLQGIRYGDWRLINAEAVVAGYVNAAADGRLTIGFRLFDVYGEAQLTGFEYTTAPANWRKVAHTIADAIYSRITGEGGYFDTRIVYVAESGPKDRRVKRLAIMDQDGANHRFLTDGSTTVLSPRFSPTRQEITYVAFPPQGGARVYLFNLDSGQREVLGDFAGMSFAPRFSPDGNGVVLAVARDGNSDVFYMDLRTRQLRQITNHPGTDISPSFSPDGRQIVFDSDRSGSQQLYIMGADGSNPTRLTFGEGRYATPVWSPRGDLIAFTRLYGGSFYVGVIRPDGTGERMLASDYRVEGPTWAPNGRVLSYFRQSRSSAAGAYSSRIFTIDLTGYNERELVTPTDGSDPAWSPLNQ